jgi:hypothetical protein
MPHESTERMIFETGRSGVDSQLFMVMNERRKYGDGSTDWGSRRSLYPRNAATPIVTLSARS